jgi:hypothetical protein
MLDERVNDLISIPAKSTSNSAMRFADVCLHSILRQSFGRRLLRKAEPRAIRALKLSAIKVASFSPSFHLLVRRTGSKSFARMSDRSTGTGRSRSQSRKSSSPRAACSVCRSGTCAEALFCGARAAGALRAGTAIKRCSNLSAKAGFRPASSANKSTRPRSNAINSFSFRNTCLISCVKP